MMDSLNNEEFNDDVDLESAVSQISSFNFQMKVPESPKAFIDKLFKLCHLLMINTTKTFNPNKIMFFLCQLTKDG